MNKLAIICATAGKREPQGLQHIDHAAYWTDTRPGWGPAANALLDRCAESGHDALFIDDDVELTAGTWALLAKHYDDAELFGPTLFTGGAITSAGFHATPEAGLSPQANLLDLMRPSYVAHVTASCLYIKAAVLQQGLRFPLWPGQHHEDVALTFEAWLRGFRVAYLPGVAYHHLNVQVGVGATKALMPTFHADRAVNYERLQAWLAEHGVRAAIARGEVPTAWRGLL